MIRKTLILLAPLLLLALLEGAFRLGVWEPFAAPNSHAGTSAHLKRALLDPQLKKIDFVTLGSSRPVYGIDHEQLAAMARKRGQVHVNLSMRGVHWMSIGVLSGWLKKEHPEIQGGIIALSVQDLAWPGNGSYELGIVQPFRSHSDAAWIEDHVHFDQAEVASFGSLFALFAWREDIRDFLTHPYSRIRRILRSTRGKELGKLSSNPDLPGNMCVWGVDTLASCEALEAASTTELNLLNQCRMIRSDITNRPDFTALASQTPFPEFMQRTRELVQSQLRQMAWKVPPIVVLMPIPPIWRNDERSAALHQWALRILQPLQSEGTIHLIDATEFFDAEAGRGCAEFGDFYHQNARGRERLSTWLMPQLEHFLQAPPKNPDR